MVKNGTILLDIKIIARMRLFRITWSGKERRWQRLRSGVRNNRLRRTTPLRSTHNIAKTKAAFGTVGGGGTPELANRRLYTQ